MGLILLSLPPFQGARLRGTRPPGLKPAGFVLLSLWDKSSGFGTDPRLTCMRPMPDIKVTDNSTMFIIRTGFV